MRRYYFHFIHRVTVSDSLGRKPPDHKAARDHAQKVADYFNRNRAFHGATAVRVTNDLGQIVLGCCSSVRPSGRPRQFLCGTPYFRNYVNPTEFVSMNGRTPHTPPRERRLVPRAARVHAKWAALFPFISTAFETEARPSRWLCGSRRTLNRSRNAWSGGQGNTLVLVLTLCLSGQKKETAACGLATASIYEPRGTGSRQP